MKLQERLRQPGVLAALGAALLFGTGTPLAKVLLQTIDPWLLAGLLYLGSGLGLTLYRRLIRAAPVRMARSEIPWLAGAIAVGGVAGPVLLMFGLTGMPASGASLLLNSEGVFTALLAWFAFKENFDRRIALGMACIMAGAVILSWPGEVRFAGLWPALAILGACLAWGIDNNLTRRVSLTDATWLASIKGLAAGAVNLMLAIVLGARMPEAIDVVRRHERRPARLRSQSGAVRASAAQFGHRPHRRLLFCGALLRCDASGDAWRGRYAATASRWSTDGVRCVAPSD